MTSLLFTNLFSTVPFTSSILVAGMSGLARNWPDWHQMGEIWDFLRSVSVHFGAGRQTVLKSDVKKSRICPIWHQSDLIVGRTGYPWFWLFRVICTDVTSPGWTNGAPVPVWHRLSTGMRLPRDTVTPAMSVVSTRVSCHILAFLCQCVKSYLGHICHFLISV